VRDSDTAPHADAAFEKGGPDTDFVWKRTCREATIWRTADPWDFKFGMLDQKAVDDCSCCLNGLLSVDYRNYNNDADSACPCSALYVSRQGLNWTRCGMEASGGDLATGAWCGRASWRRRVRYGEIRSIQSSRSHFGVGSRQDSLADALRASLMTCDAVSGQLGGVNRRSDDCDCTSDIRKCRWRRSRQH